MFKFFLIILITISCSVTLVGMENNGEQLAVKLTTSQVQLSPKALAYQELSKMMKSNATPAELKAANQKYERERMKEEEARTEPVRRNLFPERE